jgi:diguanylate cyclase (GGDEF)-like protein
MTQQLKVLIVESSRLFQTMLQDLMVRNGFEVITCHNAVTALQYVQQEDIGMVCAAYHLEDMDGISFTQKLRELPKGEQLRICLFTSEDDQELLKKALLAGATDIYNKNRFAQFVIYVQRLAQDCHKSIIGHVLLIDDSKSQRAWMKTLLENRGLDVDAFDNAEDALSAFNKHHYDLVITDIVLAGNMSGINLVREIRRTPTEKGQTAILAVSAYDDFSRRLELYHLGINDYITKPVVIEELVYRISNLVQISRLFNDLVTERKHMEKVALLDPITELYNRNAFDEFAPKELATAERGGTPFSIAILDIDYFKRVNDAYGHDRGDQVLADVGKWLRLTRRKGDMIFRWGGEEFVILMTNCKPEKAAEVLEKQRSRFNSHRHGDLLITASIGVSGVTDYSQPLTIVQLFKQADKAVYDAKGAGRDRVCLFQEQ